MTDETKLKVLRIILIVVGIIFIGGISTGMKVWPSGWAWTPPHYEYEQMIMGVYATLGVFLIIASKNPLSHRSLIQFTIWSSLVHGIIMLIQAIVDGTERGHLIGDVPAILVVAVVLWLFLPNVRTQS